MAEELDIEQVTKERDDLQGELDSAKSELAHTYEMLDEANATVAEKDKALGAFHSRWVALQAKVTQFLNKPELADTDLSRELRAFIEGVLP